MTYRLNFGNGQVHGAWPTLAQAKRAYTELREYARKYGDPWYAYIQHRVAENEWRRVRLESEES